MNACSNYISNRFRYQHHLRKKKNEMESKIPRVVNQQKLTDIENKQRRKSKLMMVRATNNTQAIVKVRNRRPLQNKNEVQKEKSVRTGFIQKPRPQIPPVTTNIVRQAPVPSKAPLRKPAPYDYKARYTLEKEKFDDLLIKYRELKEISNEAIDLKEQNCRLSVENNDLYDQVNNLILKCREFDQIKKSYDNLMSTYIELDSKHKTVVIELNKLQQEFHASKLENDRLKIESEQLALLNLEYKESLEMLEKQRRKLHNDVLDFKGKIRVFCRVRPALNSERHRTLCNLNYSSDGTKVEIQSNSEHDMITNTPKFRYGKQSFSFDQVFGQSAKQSDIFVELSYLVQSVLDGYNVCVFAYGQTGSGKTYTMEGDIDNEHLQGMIPRSIRLIFERIHQGKLLGMHFKVEASILEIYNEHIYDLLSPIKNQKEHEIRNCGNDIFVENCQHLFNLLQTAQRNRAVAATENNERSSRSHSVAKIKVTSINNETNNTLMGSLNLVDLAGSEKVSSVTHNERLTETKNINKSLSCLSNVILSLLQKNDHVPYRNSKLTYYLKPCLGGNSKTLMMVNISPFEDCYNESINALRFAASVNQCQVGTIRQNRLHN